MRKVIIPAFVVCIIAFSCFMAFIYLPDRLDKSPEIFCKSEMIEASVSITDEEILANAIARDNEDGDISNKIIIESISVFDGENVRTVKYAVADSSYNVSKTECKLKYTDYIGTHFSLDKAQIYSGFSSIETAKHIKADDILDGDISENVKILTDMTNASSGEYPYRMCVTNSAGDTCTVTVYVQIVDSMKAIPSVNLREYIKYVKQGEKFDPRLMIASVESAVVSNTSADGITSYETIPINDVEISGKVDTSAAGEYYIRYSVKNSKGTEGVSYLTVVVE